MWENIVQPERIQTTI